MTRDERTQEAEAARKAEVARLALAYRAVFGREGHRTPAQELVWANLEHLAYRHRSTMVPDKNGALCALRTSQAEGQRILFLQIEELVRRASAEDEKPAKPEVKR
jgi:hypothetical protein